MATKRQIHKYTEAALADALKAIRNGMGINKSSRHYGVPKATLQDKLAGRVPEGIRRMGPNPFLTAAEETKLVEWSIKLGTCGFPLKEIDILNMVQATVLKEKRKTPFKNGRPGRRWFASFLKRNPQLAQRFPEGLSNRRSTDKYVRDWFKGVKEYLKSINCLQILDDPDRILTCDESSFSVCPQSGEVLAPIAFKNVYTLNMANEKKLLTVLLVFSASGKTIPPMVIFPYKNPPEDVVNSMPDYWILGRSNTGCMHSENFHDYIVNGLDKWILNQNIAKPVILFVDGHKSHLTMELSDYCSKNGIILYALPPNTTNFMQPADVVFKTLKSEWKKTVNEWLNLSENNNSMVKKSTFCLVFKKALEEISVQDSIKNGFTRCGLFPFDSNAVDNDKCNENVEENDNQPYSLQLEFIQHKMTTGNDDQGIEEPVAPFEYTDEDPLTLKPSSAILEEFDINDSQNLSKISASTKSRSSSPASKRLKIDAYNEKLLIPIDMTEGAAREQPRYGCRAFFDSLA